MEIIAIVVVPFTIALISYLLSRKESNKALAVADKALAVAEKALSEATFQFTTLNRPLLNVMPDSFKKENNYFDIAVLDEKKLILKIPIVIKNQGNLVADNTFLHSSNCMLHINDKLITGSVNKYETLSGKLTLMDILPKEGVVKIVDFEFQLPPNLDLEKFRNDLISRSRLDTNFLFHYYSHLDKEKPFASNISYAISYKGYTIIMIKH